MSEKQTRKVIDAPELLARVTEIKKAEGDSILQSSAMTTEDDFASEYAGTENDFKVLKPPYPLERLHELVSENNALSQCVDAMEVNIDGTGFEIEPVTPAEGDANIEQEDTEIEAVKEFFNEVWPGRSFVTERRQLRRDLESTGCGYFEVVRNPKGDIVFIRALESITMRLLKLGDPVVSTKSVMRGGSEQKVRVSLRERAFVQKVGNKKVYFKEFGASRDINRETGEWSDQGQKFPANVRGSEIIYFTIHKATKSPYGVPRWISQLPSVLGSRKAEELNLDYFDSGGIPPVVVFVAGGAISNKTVRAQIENLFNGTAKDKTRGAVVDVVPTGGDIGKDGKVDIKVERFGSEKQNDALFENYDDKCERRIRSSFRLPPLFVGKAEDYSFATAFASYSVADAQVFDPERHEFDEIINNTIMREIAPNYRFRSKQIAVKDVENQLKAIELAVKAKVVDGEDLVQSLNEVAGTNLRFTAPDETDLVEGNVEEGDGSGTQEPPDGQSQDGAVQPQPEGDTDAQGRVVVQKTDPMEVLGLVEDFMELAGLSQTAREVDEAFKTALHGRIASLDPDAKAIFNRVLANNTLIGVSQDLEGLSELCGCAAQVT